MSIEAKEEFRPKIVAFCCNWCSYAGADLAGSSRLSYPADVKIIRVPCSCRVNPMFILRAFEKGADGVIMCGCHPGDCFEPGNIDCAGYALWRCWRFCGNLFQYCVYLRVGRALCDIQIQAEKTGIHIFYKIWCISCRNGFHMVDNRDYMQAFYRRTICLPDLQRNYLCDRTKPAALGGLQENRKLEKNGRAFASCS